MKSTVRRHIRSCCAVLLCILAPAITLSCTSLLMDKGKGSKTEDSLLSSIKSFNAALRWGDYRSASVWVPAPLKEKFWQNADVCCQGLRIVDYQVREVGLEQGRAIGNVILTYRYYQPANPTLQTKTLTQKWVFLEDQKAWQVMETGFETLIKTNS